MLKAKLIIWWSFDDWCSFVNEWTNKQKLFLHYLTFWLSDDHLLFPDKNKQTNTILSAGDHMLIIWWSFANYLTIKNKQIKFIIWLASDDHWMIISSQITNKQTNKYYHLLIIWWSFNDHILSDNKQTNKAFHLFFIIHYLKQTNKQINNQTTLIIFWSSADNLMIIYW